MRLRFAQKAFIVHQGRLLLVRKSSTDPYNPGLWEVPGGRVRTGEGVDVHICREVWEEVGLAIVPGRPFHVWDWTLDESTGDAQKFYAVARLCVTSSIEFSTEHRAPGDHLDEVRWVPFDELGKYDMIPDMEPVLQDFLDICVAGSGSWLPDSAVGRGGNGAGARARR